MAKIAQFDKPSLRLLRPAIDKALAQVAADFGIKLETGKISYSGPTATIKIEAGVIGASGIVETKERQAWAQLADLYGFPADALDMIITLRGERFRIAGLLPNGPKFPVLVVRVRDGEALKLTKEGALREIAATKAIAQATA